MNWLMQGFLIAIYVLLSFIYFRLGRILDEIKDKNYKAPEIGNCLNCANQDTPVINEPCYSCITSDSDFPNWEPERK